MARVYDALFMMLNGLKAMIVAVPFAAAGYFAGKDDKSVGSKVVCIKGNFSHFFHSSVRIQYGLRVFPRPDRPQQPPWACWVVLVT